MTIKILTPGLTLIQDHGRGGHEHVGVSASGAFNRTRYEQVARLLDASNPAALEVLHGKLSFRAITDTLVCVVGADTAHVDGRPGPQNMVFILFTGQTLAVSPATSGPAYVGVLDLRAPSTLGSACFDTLSGLGTPQLATADTFNTPTLTSAMLLLVGRFLPVRANDGPASTLRFVPGPHGLAGPSLQGTWTPGYVTRSGIRLTGPLTEALAGPPAALPSFPVLPGSIQLPPDGHPIVLGPDAGVTGGYPVVGVIVSADVHLLSTLAPGRPVRLVAVDAADAQRTYFGEFDRSSIRVTDPAYLGG